MVGRPGGWVVWGCRCPGAEGWFQRFGIGRFAPLRIFVRSQIPRPWVWRLLESAATLSDENSVRAEQPWKTALVEHPLAVEDIRQKRSKRSRLQSKRRWELAAGIGDELLRISGGLGPNASTVDSGCLGRVDRSSGRAVEQQRVAVHHPGDAVKPSPASGSRGRQSDDSQNCASRPEPNNSRHGRASAAPRLVNHPRHGLSAHHPAGQASELAGASKRPCRQGKVNSC